MGERRWKMFALLNFEGELQHVTEHDPAVTESAAVMRDLGWTAISVEVREIPRANLTKARRDER